MRYDDPSLMQLAAQAEQRYGLPANILNAIRLGGERSHSWQVSPKQAKGVYQFIPSTWRAYGGNADPTDPVAATDAAGKMIADLMKQYRGNIEAVLAHYNGGTASGRAALQGRFTNPETAAYVPRAMAKLRALSGPEQRASAPSPQAADEDLYGLSAAAPSSLDLELGVSPTADYLGAMQQAPSRSPLVAQRAEPAYNQDSMESEMDSLFGLSDDALLAGIAGAPDFEDPMAGLSSLPSSELIGGMSVDDIRALFDEEVNDG